MANICTICGMPLGEWTHICVASRGFSNLDITERSILESERDELTTRNIFIEHNLMELRIESLLFSKLISFIPKSVWLDILSVLEYGQGAHKPDEWKERTVAFHLGRAYKHLEDYLRGETIDPDTHKSVLYNIIIRVCMAAALEKEQ